MGKIKAGILSPVSGKIGGVVGGKWKDKAYLRQFVVPANPQTAGQITQRGLFGKAVDFGKNLVGPVFNVYTDMFQPKMSGFNFFIKRNITVFTSSPVYANIKITEGKLYAPETPTASFGASPGIMVVNWVGGTGSNGKASDPCFAVAYNVTKNTWGFFSAPHSRSTESVNMAMNWSAADVIHVWIFASQYEGTILKLISNSAHCLATYSV